MPSAGSAGSAARPAHLTERHVLALGLGVAGLFVVVALAVAVVTVLRGGSSWAALHLALAGAATVAIGAFMPHFAVTLAGTRPASPSQRLIALGLLGAGGAAVIAGVTLLGGTVAAIGAAAQLIGLAFVGWHTISPSRDPLARRHHVVALAYVVALIELAAGVALGGLSAVGVPAVLAAWSVLRPAHAWLTLFGAVSLTIFSTLVYLAPTVLGARIRASASLFVGLGGMVVGPPIAALGFALASPGVTTAGAAITALGGVGQVGFVLDARARRGGYTSEHDWRRVAVGHLLAGTGWFVAAAAAAGVGLLLGSPLHGWSIGILAVPMVAGWMLQELVGSWTHLLPSVTPGDAAAHARQRRILAFVSRSRLVAWNAGVALLWAGVATSIGGVAAVGGAALAGSVALSVILLARALAVRDR
jgi:nitrite reductase (NO-forming)